MEATLRRANQCLSDEIMLQSKSMINQIRGNFHRSGLVFALDFHFLEIFSILLVCCLSDYEIQTMSNAYGSGYLPSCHVVENFAPAHFPHIRQ